MCILWKANKSCKEQLRQNKITRPERMLFTAICALVILLIGAASNFLAVTSNECRMPVLIKEYSFKDSTHFSFKEDSEVRFPLLSDRITLYKNIVSVGDIIMTACVLVVIYCLIGFTRSKKIYKLGNPTKSCRQNSIQRKKK